MSGIELDPREDKLPKWAQHQMSRLRSEIERLRVDRPAHDKQWAYIENFRHDAVPLPVSTYERITCVPMGADPTSLDTPRLGVRMEDDGALSIMCHDGPLVIYSRSSNVIEVKADER